jgi:hypothetical protein
VLGVAVLSVVVGAGEAGDQVADLGGGGVGGVGRRWDPAGVQRAVQESAEKLSWVTH